MLSLLLLLQGEEIMIIEKDLWAFLNQYSLFTLNLRGQQIDQPILYLLCV